MSDCDALHCVHEGLCDLACSTDQALHDDNIAGYYRLLSGNLFICWNADALQFLEDICLLVKIHARN